MITAKPNLFEHATKELSQDAILAWLLQWADPACATMDRALHETGRFFIKSLFEKAKTQANTWKQLPQVTKVKIDPQKFKIDLLVWLECADGISRVILIEDKIHSGVHSDQLNRYLQAVARVGIPRDCILPVFLKTGYQHEWSAAQEAGYTEFTARDLRDVWRFGETSDVQNDIFADFRAHLNTLEERFGMAELAFLNFSNIPVGQWDHWHWKGFFHYAQSLLTDPASRAGHGEQQNRREHLLFFYFGFVPILIQGYTDKLEPNLNLTYANGQTVLEIRLWVKHLDPVLHLPFRLALNKAIKAIGGFGNAEEGVFRPAKESIRLLKIPFPDRFDQFSATELLEYLRVLKSALQQIERILAVER